MPPIQQRQKIRPCRDAQRCAAIATGDSGERRASLSRRRRRLPARAFSACMAASACRRGRQAAHQRQRQPIERCIWCARDFGCQQHRQFAVGRDLARRFEQLARQHAAGFARQPDPLPSPVLILLPKAFSSATTASSARRFVGDKTLSSREAEMLLQHEGREAFGPR